jgi:hypothetical protein
MRRIVIALLACLWASLAAAQPLPGTWSNQTFGVVAAATGTTGGATATLPAVQGKITYICGFSVAPGAATAAITINVTVTGPSSTFTWSVGAPAVAAGTTGAVLTVSFGTCVPASAPNTSIAVAAGALGAGGVSQDVNAWGYQN